MEIESNSFKMTENVGKKNPRSREDGPRMGREVSASQFRFTHPTSYNSTSQCITYGKKADENNQ